MADTLDILTLAEARTALNQGSTYTGDDARIENLVTALSRRLDDPDRGVGPVVQRTVTTEAHDGGCVTVGLDHYPVVSVTTVTEDGDTITSTGYELYSATGLLYRRNGDRDQLWEAGRNNIAVTYEAGRYTDTASVDWYYKEGAVLFLKHLWRAEQWSTDGIGTTDFDVPQVAFPAFAVPNAVKDFFKGAWRGDFGGFA